MKMSHWLSFLFIGCALTLGCNKETEEGGPGATPGAQSQNGDLEEATFTLTLPDGVNATQTEDTESSISLNAGDKFNQEVKVDLTVPAGVKIEPKSFTLSKNKDEQKLMIRADATATEGDHVVKVVGTPATGKEVPSTFKVTVDIDE